MALGYYGLDGEPIGQLEWSRLFEDTEGRQVADTTVGDARVSTVWVGLDLGPFGLGGPPLIFETMILGGPHDEGTWRYPNRVAAIAGHDQAVALAREAAALEVDP